MSIQLNIRTKENALMQSLQSSSSLNSPLVLDQNALPADTVYELASTITGSAPASLEIKKVGLNLEIIVTEPEQAQIIIENYYATPTQTPIIGKSPSGHYHSYISQTGFYQSELATLTENQSATLILEQGENIATKPYFDWLWAGLGTVAITGVSFASINRNSNKSNSPSINSQTKNSTISPTLPATEETNKNPTNSENGSAESENPTAPPTTAGANPNPTNGENGSAESDSSTTTPPPTTEETSPNPSNDESDSAESDSSTTTPLTTTEGTNPNPTSGENGSTDSEKPATSPTIPYVPKDKIPDPLIITWKQQGTVKQGSLTLKPTLGGDTTAYQVNYITEDNRSVSFRIEKKGYQWESSNKPDDIRLNTETGEIYFAPNQLKNYSQFTTIVENGTVQTKDDTIFADNDLAVTEGVDIRYWNQYNAFHKGVIVTLPTESSTNQLQFTSGEYRFSVMRNSEGNWELNDRLQSEGAKIENGELYLSARLLQDGTTLVVEAPNGLGKAKLSFFDYDPADPVTINAIAGTNKIEISPGEDNLKYRLYSINFVRGEVLDDGNPELGIPAKYRWKMVDPWKEFWEPDEVNIDWGHFDPETGKVTFDAKNFVEIYSYNSTNMVGYSDERPIRTLNVFMKEAFIGDTNFDYSPGSWGISHSGSYFIDITSDEMAREISFVDNISLSSGNDRVRIDLQIPINNLSSIDGGAGDDHLILVNNSGEEKSLSLNNDGLNLSQMEEVLLQGSHRITLDLTNTRAFLESNTQQADFPVFIIKGDGTEAHQVRLDNGFVSSGNTTRDDITYTVYAEQGNIGNELWISNAEVIY